MKNVNTWIQVIEKLTPLISVIVVGVMSWLPSFLTNRENRKLAIYNKKKEDLELFSKSCGKYFGITSILTAVLETTHDKSNDAHYADEVVRLLTECKWDILSYLNVEKSKEVCGKMEQIEDFAEELRQARIMQNLWLITNDNEKLQEKIDNIYDHIKPKIYDVSHDLQSLLTEHKQIMSCELEYFRNQRRKTH